MQLRAQQSQRHSTKHDHAKLAKTRVETIGGSNSVLALYADATTDLKQREEGGLGKKGRKRQARPMDRSRVSSHRFL